MEQYALIHIVSITFANVAIKKLGANGIYAQIKKAPAAVSKNGCGYCLKVSLQSFKRAVSILLDSGFEIKGAYEVRSANEIVRISI